MNTGLATPLLGGLSPQLFMRRHWQKKPLRVRGAIDPGGFAIERETLFELASRDDVRSRLVVREGTGWRLRHGPIARRSLPALRRPGWTLLVQALDRHLPAMHELLARFRFVPQARLDDVMVSYASDQGGVGPHFDSYDVFLVQVHGRRRWRIGRLREPQLQPDVPLKILTNFVAEEEWVLDPGDLLYLPPRWAHDGVALGECITASIGFRAPQRASLARALMQQMLEAQPPESTGAEPVYRDPRQAATDRPGQIPEALTAFAHESLQAMLGHPRELACALGELLSEPDPEAGFAPAVEPPATRGGVVLARSSRMLYDRRHVFINGESFLAGGRDAVLMRRLADRARLTQREVESLSPAARGLLEQWQDDGWLQGLPPALSERSPP